MWLTPVLASFITIYSVWIIYNKRCFLAISKDQLVQLLQNISILAQLLRQKAYFWNLD